MQLEPFSQVEALLCIHFQVFNITASYTEVSKIINVYLIEI